MPPLEKTRVHRARSVSFSCAIVSSLDYNVSAVQGVNRVCLGGLYKVFKIQITHSTSLIISDHFQIVFYKFDSS